MSFLREFFRFMAARKKFWLVPILLMCVLLGGLLFLTKGSAIAPFIYTGIQLVSHRLLQGAPEGPFSTNLLWNRAMAEGRLYGISFTGLWFEVGTPQMIRPTEEALTGG